MGGGEGGAADGGERTRGNVKRARLGELWYAVTAGGGRDDDGGKEEKHTVVTTTWPVLET